jgi:hypothetical protein
MLAPGIMDGMLLLLQVLKMLPPLLLQVILGLVLKYIIILYGTQVMTAQAQA